MSDMAFDRITTEIDKLGGRPCIRGLRISVAHVVRLVAAGWTLAEIQEELSLIEPDDVRQALLYAVTTPNGIRIGDLPCP